MTAHELGHILNEIRHNVADTQRDVKGLMNLRPAAAGLIRKVDRIMVDVTNITAAVGTLETASSDIITAIAALRASNTDAQTQAELDALTARVAAVANGLHDAATPPANP